MVVPMSGASAGALAPAGMIIVAYGKFGGIELGYGSDLDLVFLHDSHGEVQRTNGAATRREQRVLPAPGAACRAPADGAHGRRQALRSRHAVATERQGRPAGAEHRWLRRLSAQRGLDLGAPGAVALTCRRGHALALRERFEALRRDLLANAVRRDTLREDVRAMRERMRAELSQVEARRVRPETGRRWDHRHRVPRAVLGLALGRPLSGTGRCSRTTSASWRASPRSTSCRRQPSTCSRRPTVPIGNACTICRWTAKAASRLPRSSKLCVRRCRPSGGTRCSS